VRHGSRGTAGRRDSRRWAGRARHGAWGDEALRHRREHREPEAGLRGEMERRELRGGHGARGRAHERAAGRGVVERDDGRAGGRGAGLGDPQARGGAAGAGAVLLAGGCGARGEPDARAAADPGLRAVG
jgi:hypothetical protein